MPPRRARAPAAAAAPARGYTVVCSKSACVKGKFKPSGGKTAHVRLAESANMKNPVCGGSIKPGGAVGLRSESINRSKHGKCDMTGTRIGDVVTRRIAAGQVSTVSAYKARNQKNTR